MLVTIFILKLKTKIASPKRNLGGVTGIIIRKPPTASLLPITYRAKRNATLAGIAGFFVSIFLAFFIEYIKNASRATQKTN